MHSDEYQAQAALFMNNDLTNREVMLMCTLGIASESGEIAEEIKHHFYHGHDLDAGNLYKECGDILWYVSQLCKVMNWKLSDVMAGNIGKLTNRYPEGFSSKASINREENKPVECELLPKL